MLYHPCVQLTDPVTPLLMKGGSQHGSRKLRFCPPTKEFELCQYRLSLNDNDLPVKAFYQMKVRANFLYDKPKTIFHYFSNKILRNFYFFLNNMIYGSRKFHFCQRRIKKKSKVSINESETAIFNQKRWNNTSASKIFLLNMKLYFR